MHQMLPSPHLSGSGASPVSQCTTHARAPGCRENLGRACGALRFACFGSRVQGALVGR
jgi:hypothetical protein